MCHDKYIGLTSKDSAEGISIDCQSDAGISFTYSLGPSLVNSYRPKFNQVGGSSGEEKSLNCDESKFSRSPDTMEEDLFINIFIISIIKIKEYHTSFDGSYLR